MNRYKITLEGHHVALKVTVFIQALDVAQAMRIAAQNLDLDDAKQVTIHLMDKND